MDPTCLDHLLTEEERIKFEEEGYLILPEVLSEEETDKLEEVTDRLDAEAREKAEKGRRPAPRPGGGGCGANFQAMSAR